MVQDRRQPRTRGRALVAGAVAAIALGIGALALRGGAVELPGTAELAPGGDASAAVRAAAADVTAPVAAGAPSPGDLVAATERSDAGPAGRVIVTVVDEDGAPIEGAVPRLVAGGYYGPERQRDIGGAAAVTGRDGRAAVAAVAPGRWFVRAEHADYMYSPFLQTDRGAVAVGASDVAVTVVMVEPFIAAVEVRNGRVLASEFAAPRGDWSYFDDRELDAVRRRFASRWPAVALGIWVLRREDAIPTPASTSVQILVDGRLPWEGTAPLCRLRRFRAPMILDAEQLTRNDDFGSVTFRALDVAGAPCGGLAIELRQWGDQRALGRFVVAAGAECRVPTGLYEPSCSAPFVRQLLPPWVAVGRGAAAAVDLDGRLLAHTAITLEGPAVATRAQLRHSALREPVWIDLREGKGRGDYWWPEGTLVVAWFPRERGVGLGDPGGRSPLAGLSPLARSAELALGGGTGAAPQQLIVRPQ